jgi:hypothetical protein
VTVAKVRRRRNISRWCQQRFFGLASLGVVLLGQFGILLVAVFAPDEPPAIGEIRRHWTDDLATWWLACSVTAVLLAVLGLVADRERDIAALGLSAAFAGFLWPWGA